MQLDNQTTTTAAAAAKAWHAAGYSVVPARADGTKAPIGAWRQYTQHQPTTQQIDAWYANGATGVGLVCGQVSGGLEMLELEGRAVQSGALTQLENLASKTGLAALWMRLTSGYAETTPSGGIHLLYRVDGIAVPGNTRLAQRPALPGELTDDERRILATKPDKVFWRVLAETRGEGGYTVVAPSCGPVHPTGRPWVVTAGRAGTVPTITAAERADLHTLFRTIGHSGVSKTADTTFTAPATPAWDTPGISPGDDFEQRTDWADILTPHGWRQTHTAGDTTYWLRPGKTAGVSATTGHSGDRDRLFVFSSSTEFEPETPYTKFGAYALLSHGGSHTAAARSLASSGYGTRHQTPAINTIGATPTQSAAEQNTDQTPGFRSTLLRRSQLKTLPPVLPLIQDTLSLRVSAVLVGATGLGKTFVALSWACSVATGKPWLGQVAERHPVLYTVGEGASGLDSRITAWEQYHNALVDDDDLIFSIKPDSLANIRTWIEMREQALDLGVRFVVLDTFSSLAPDADETKDAATITRRLSDLSAAIDGTALLIHHPGWGDSGRTRGGYQLEANVDEVVVLTGEADSDLIEMTQKKVKEGVAGRSQWLRRRQFDNSVVIESATAVDVDKPLGARILRALVDADGVPVSAPQLQKDLGIEDRTRVWRGLTGLIRDGHIDAGGSERRRTYTVTPAGIAAARGQMFTPPGCPK